MSQTLTWGKQTSRNFKDIVLECARNTEGVSVHDDLFLFDAKDTATVKRFHDNLPYTVRQTMNMYTLGRDDLTFPINIKFDRTCVDKTNNQINLHSELTDVEKRAIEQTLKEICGTVGAQFYGITSKGEFIVKNEDFDELSDFLVSVVSTRLGGVQMKYIAPYSDEENAYRLYFRKNSEDDPVHNRYLYIRSASAFQCPKCDSDDLKSVNEDEDHTTFCCISCGMAVQIEYMSLQEEFEVDAPSEEIQKECESYIREAYENKGIIDIESDLRLIGETDEVKLYEDVDVYPYSDQVTELWVQKENSPVVIYDLNKQEFLDEHYQQGWGSMCDVCNEESDPIRVEGAYYEQGAGIHEKDINMCKECKDELMSHVREILRGSEDVSDYLRKIL